MAPVYPFSFKAGIGSFYGEEHIEHYTKRAKGGAGLIILQGTDVIGAADGINRWSVDNVLILKQIVENCHSYGSTVLIQLSCGNVDINRLSVDEVHLTQLDMKHAALAACEIGFDGVEFHCAHGFTLCKFLDASLNQRSDQYGNDATNRTRVLTEILPDIRNNTHSNFVMGVRMGEYLPESRDGIEVAKIFENAGIDLIHISFGAKPPDHAVPEGFKCGPMAYSGCKIKKELGIPVIAVHEIKTGEQVRFLLEHDYVDLVAIGRGMLADSEFANHVINNEPINNCYECGGDLMKCFWFTDHTKCPAIQEHESNDKKVNARRMT